VRADLGSGPVEGAALDEASLHESHALARERWEEIRRLERKEIGEVNRRIEAERLALRRASLRQGAESAQYRDLARRGEAELAAMQSKYDALAERARALRAEDQRFRITLADVNGREKEQLLSDITRFYPANRLSAGDALGIYLSRWVEFLSEEPREANTEGGVLPAIFGTAAMTLLMVIAVAPFGIVTALYLREYARQGRLVSIVRISVNNLAGVPSIVYGVFGLGFFAYTVGARIDQLFYPERLPSPTFGTGGLLWASLTLALLTVPVVIVATEEALAAVPRSVREGSLACGASKWQTIRRIVLPQALPGIMTGLILAMARGAGEVAPLMLVGVVKLAPELPVDGIFPFVHFQRSFMHLGFHIYDVGFQSRNSEAGKPMVYVTTLLLISLIALMNATAILVRARLKRRFAGSQF
jgi:phosphate transport system permease protein